MQATRPSRQLIKELADLYAKHHWPGQPIGVSNIAPQNVAVLSGVEPDITCPEGMKPVWVTIPGPGDKDITFQVCVPN